MNKSLKEIADELKISKQKIYRFIKDNHINEAVQDGQTKRYDEAVQALIKQHFSQSKPHHEPHQNHINNTVYDAVLKQLDIKDKQIEDLNKQLEEALRLLDQEQKLNLVNQQKIALLESKEDKTQRKWWKFKKRDQE